MNRIKESGDRILKIQRELGLPNPKNYNPGLTYSELKELALFHRLSPDSELHDLYAWRNGSTLGVQIPMECLWFIPNFYFYPAQRSFEESQYCSVNFPDWPSSWFAVLTDGSAGRYFCDVEKTSNGQLPVFYYEPEEIPVTGRIYDSIESMFSTVLKCYEQGAYFVNAERVLDADWPRKVEISRKLNPNSDYWLRDDLY